MGLALHTDLYELTMAAAYFREGIHERRAVFEVFVRHLPRRRRWLLAAGLEQVLSFLETLRFEDDELELLAAQPSLSKAFEGPGFREFLSELRFSGDVWAMPEGTIFFPGEPLLRVEAPLVEAQLVETFVLSALNHASAIATKAARIVEAAGKAKVVEFGARRAHPEAAVDAARAAYVGGCVGTSNLEATRRYGIPCFGTAAHSFTMVHDTELDAFCSFVATFPRATLLIDTYDTIEGAKNAVRAGGSRLGGVRLDSGDFDSLSRAVRRILDDAGLREARIVASGDLDEERIAELIEGGAPIDVFGVGTQLVISKDAPALGGVYKLVAVERDGRLQPAAKFSEGKVTWPGAKQVFRHPGQFDELALADEPTPRGSEPLLVQVMRGGKRIHAPEPLDHSRERALRGVAELPVWLRRVGDEPLPRGWEVRPTRALVDMLLALRARHPGHQAGVVSSDGSPA